MVRPAKKEKLFTKETDLCAAFLAAVPGGWLAYPETGGWDILLVRVADGFQIGIQAKLTFNAKVLNQTIEKYVSYWSGDTGPDCRAVLVPSGEGDLGAIAAYIGVTVIQVFKADRYDYHQKPGCDWRFRPTLPGTQHYSDEDDHWFDWLPARRHKLPGYVPDVAAGSAAPVQLTTWKIKAIKIAVLLKRRGFVTKADFKHLHLDHRRWTEKGSGWLVLDPEAGVYRAASFTPDLERVHPRNYTEIDEDFAQWAPQELPLQPKQKALPL